MTDMPDDVARVYRFWGRHATWYRLASAPTFLFRERRIRGAAVRALRLRPGDRALEVACGTGLNLPLLRAAVGPAGTVVGVDASPQMLAAAAAAARAAGWTNVRLLRGDASRMPVRDGAFDGALSVLGLSAVPRWREAVRRIRAALRPGGRLAVCDARLLRGPWRVFNPVIEPLFRWSAAWHPEADIPAEMRAVFGDVGIESFNGGSMYVAVARVRDAPAS